MKKRILSTLSLLFASIVAFSASADVPPLPDDLSGRSGTSCQTPFSPVLVAAVALMIASVVLWRALRARSSR